MGFFDLGYTIVLGVPTPVWVAALCFIVFGVLLNKTVYGRNTLAIGGNPEAARLAGVNVNMTRIVIFLIQGVIAALAGVILAARITSGQPNAAQGFELNVISACVLGGVSLLGGRASISGVLVGVLIMGTVQNAMNLLNIDAFYQYLVRGGILLAAVLVDQLKNRGGRD
jgi:L-arabinose transport system permease protein